MIEKLLAFIAPHHCFGCGILGFTLCESCKYDIVSEAFSACVGCGVPIVPVTGLCAKCKYPYERAWCVADRRDQLQRLIDGYKFRNARAAYWPLADLLHLRLPDLPKETVIVPIPTISSHIRQRGYDHMLLIARQLGRFRHLPVNSLLTRATNTTQRGAKARERDAQAKAAFVCQSQLNSDAVYLLVDDVITSGATVNYAAQTLRNAGASRVWVASISRQLLD